MAKSAKNAVAAANVAASVEAPVAATPVAANDKPAIPTDAEMRAEGKDQLSTRIRHLSALGVSTADITRIVKRSNGEAPKYQHVRNVLKTPLKRVEEAPATAEAN